MKNAENKYNEILKQAKTSTVLDWSILTELQKDLFNEWVENKGKPTIIDMTKSVKVLHVFYYVGDLFSEPAWVCLAVDGTMTVTAALIVGHNKQDCACQPFNLNQTCKHTQVVKAFLGVLQKSEKVNKQVPTNSWGVQAYYSNDSTGIVQSFDFIPFVQTSGTFSIPSKVQESLNKGDG